MLSNSSSTQSYEICRYSYPHLVDSVGDLEDKGSLYPFSNTDGEKQMFRVENTKRLVRICCRYSIYLPDSHKISMLEQKGNRTLPSDHRAAPCKGWCGSQPQRRSHRELGGFWTFALEGQLCSRLKWEQDLCFLEIPASALRLPSFLKYNFPSYKYLSRAEESHKTARSWWQRYFGHSNPLFLFWQNPSWAPSLTSSERTYSVINRES